MEEERRSERESEGDDNNEDDDELHQRYKSLQQYWDSLQSNPRRRGRRSLHRCCCSSDTKTPVLKSLRLLQNSPSVLMASLQHRRRESTPSPSPLEGVWKVRTNDLAVEEILRERRAAIESGRVKGRRLFWGMESATEMDLGFSDWSDLVQGSDLRSGDSKTDETDNGQSNCRASSGHGDGTERENMVVVVEGENVREKIGVSSGRRRWRFIMGWVGIALVLFGLGFIMLLRSVKGGNGDEVFLVPT